MAYNMMSPSVQVNELDYSDYVSAVSSSIVGMVGCARRGPMTPTLITSQEQFVRVFGTPSTQEYGGYSALQALTKVSSLYYQRVVHQAPKATAGESGVDKYIFTSIVPGSKVNGQKIVITQSGTDWTIKVTDKTDKILETFDGVKDATSDKDSILSKINNSSKLISVVMMDKGTISAKTLIMNGGEDGAAYGTAGSKDLPFTIRTKYYDSTLNLCIVKFSKPDLAGYFDMEILTKDRTEVIERLQNMTLDPTDERYVDTLVENSSDNIVVKYNKDFQKTSTVLDVSSVEYVIEGGDDGIAKVDVNDIIGKINTGLQAFSNPEVIDINILCAPGWYQASVVNAGTAICSERGDATYIFGTPFGLSAQRANDWINGAGEFTSDHSAFDSSYSSAYWPWIQYNDNYTHKKIWLPPEGFICAVYAYNDTVSQLWYAPAGLNRGLLFNAEAVEYSATKGERDLVYGGRNCLNTIINYRNQGIVVWGQKTTQRKATALNRINVRRLLNYLKKVIASSTNYFLFDPNDEYQWNRWIDMVTPVMENVKQLRGVNDFKIEMSPTTSEVENNMMPGVIKIKPTKSAEYIPISFMVSPQSAVFHEEINS